MHGPDLGLDLAPRDCPLEVRSMPCRAVRDDMSSIGWLGSSGSSICYSSGPSAPLPLYAGSAAAYPPCRIDRLPRHLQKATRCTENLALLCSQTRTFGWLLVSTENLTLRHSPTRRLWLAARWHRESGSMAFASPPPLAGCSLGTDMLRLCNVRQIDAQ